MKTLKDVIPTFWRQPNVQSLVENGRAKKTHLQKILSPYLKKLLEIAEGKVTKDEYLIYTGGLSLDHISDKYEQIELLLKLDNTDLPAISRTQRQAKTNARKAIFTENGVEVSTLRRYRLVENENDLSQEETEVIVEFNESLS